MIKRKILVFFWSLIVLLSGSLFYFFNQILSGSQYRGDLIFIALLIAMLFIAMILLLAGYYRISSTIILMAILFPSTLIVWFGHTLTELKLYNLAFLLSSGIIYSILVAVRAWQIFAYGAGAAGITTAFLLFRLLPAAEEPLYPYWNSFTVVLILLTMETMVAFFAFYLLNKIIGEVQFLAEHDESTGLPNGNRLNIDLRRDWKDRTNGQIHYYRIENYSDLLLNFGLEETDKAVMHVANLLSEVNRRSVYRLSANLFSLFHIDQRCETEQCMANVMKRFRIPIKIEGAGLPVILRGAILKDKSLEQDMSSNVNRGLLALFQAESENRQFVVFEKEREKFWTDRLNLFHELSHALEKKQFFVVYQPLFDSSRKLASMEALSRWVNRNGQPVSPALFIPIIEQAGMMNEFFFLMVARVLEDLKSQSTMKGNFPVFINLSPELVNQNFDFPSLLEMIENSGIPASRLGFEITESAIINSSDEMEQIMEILRQKGHPLALDDFGTGYSNLTRILTLPFSKVKFDRSFLLGMKENSSYGDLLEVLISFLNSKSYGTVIEGIESMEDFNLLSELGCGEFQGFFLGKPVPPTELTL
jgi:EAL domain-containing protein (putative c-di-GMP-specific phosphodiesterase class I)/GGDEF domain-containing protein